MKLRFRLILIAGCGLLSSLALAQDTFGTKPVTMTVRGGNSTSNKVHEFYSAMDKLWEDHVAWTRLYIVSAVENLPDKTATTDRLMQNQVDIGDAIKPYYGEAAGNQLTTLLKEHISQAAELIEASKTGETARAATAKTAWFENSDRISAFLAKANPSWSESEMRSMMHDHLNLTLDEATARLKGDYVTEIRAYDKVHDQIREMATMLSDGIVAQYPERFAVTGQRSLAEDMKGPDNVTKEWIWNSRYHHYDPFSDEWWQWHKRPETWPGGR